MVALHAGIERHVRSSNPLVSESRAVLGFHARRWYYPDGDIDKVRFIQNPGVPGNLLEGRFPVLELSDTPVLVTARNAREVYTRAWIDGDKEIDIRDPLVDTFAASISCGFAWRINRADLPSFPDVLSCWADYSICRRETGTTWINYSGYKNTTRIPRCMERYTNLLSLDLSRTPVSRIENLDKNVKLKLLNLVNTKVSDEEKRAFAASRPGLTVY